MMNAFKIKPIRVTGQAHPLYSILLSTYTCRPNEPNSQVLGHHTTIKWFTSNQSQVVTELLTNHQSGLNWETSKVRWKLFFTEINSHHTVQISKMIPRSVMYYFHSSMLSQLVLQYSCKCIFHSYNYSIY